MNTRNSYNRYPARYNNTGTFVPAANTTIVQPVQTTYNQKNDPQSMWVQEQPQEQSYIEEPIKEDNGDNMITEGIEGNGEDGTGGRKWIKKGFKLSMRERRRRQNKQLRKLLTPKNALTVLNELTPGTQHECNVVQEQDQYGGNLNKQYVAVLNVGGIEYRGTGVSKLLAKNNAAEQVIRDAMIKQMASLPESSNSSDDKIDITDNEEVASFPMMQLASYALHKLFTEWQQEGFKVPSLGPAKSSSNISDKVSVTSENSQASKKPKKIPTLPSNAVHLHPCMLLSQMRNDATYTLLAVGGIKPNTPIFTMGVNVDGTTYVGEAQNKKEARRLAAKKACEALFGLVYQEDGKVSIEDM